MKNEENKGGRPKMSADEKKTSGISARLTQEERDFADELVDRIGISNDTELIGMLLRNMKKKGVEKSVMWLMGFEG